MSLLCMPACLWYKCETEQNTWQRKAGKAVFTSNVTVLALKDLHKAHCHTNTQISTAEAVLLAWLRFKPLAYNKICIRLTATPHESTASDGIGMGCKELWLRNGTHIQTTPANNWGSFCCLDFWSITDKRACHAKALANSTQHRSPQPTLAAQLW